MVQQALGIIGTDPVETVRLAKFFMDNGFAVQSHESVHTLLAGLAAHPSHVALICAPAEDPAAGAAMLRLLREQSRLPCVMLGGRDEISPVMMLEAGADDVFDRSIPLRAMLARIRAILRRAEWGLELAQSTVAVNGWNLVAERRQLLRPDGSECHLTTAEFDLMQLLLCNRGRAVDRDAIAEAVFHRPFRAEDRTVDNLVLRLRRKLGTRGHAAIKTVRGAGYMFVGFRERDPPGLRVA